VLTDEQVAEICHEANRAYCRGLGDYHQPRWEDAPEWQRGSALSGVRLHRAKACGPEASHEAWYNEKKAQGWRYGPVKDPVNKEHPCMVPFEDLPEEQQAKDVLFAAIVAALS
jgi:hypothetical protein